MRVFVNLVWVVIMLAMSGPVLSVQWARQGEVLTAGVGDNSNVLEPSVIRETGAQILSGTVYKMWYTSGWGTVQINYAESNDGITWTKYGSNPILANHCRSSVFKSGTTYYMYTANATDTQIDLYTSTDGVTLALDTSSTLALGAGGAWDDGNIANTFVWKEGANDWRMLYEGKRAGGVWKIGYATSSDGKSWSKSGSNPVITETGSLGGPFIYKAVDGIYWLWVHRTVSSTLPTDLARYKSSNLTTWTRDPADRNTLLRLTADEGINTSVGQVADPFLLEVNSQTYLWYDGSADGTQASGALRIKLAIAPMPIERLITTMEGE